MAGMVEDRGISRSVSGSGGWMTGTGGSMISPTQTVNVGWYAQSHDETPSVPAMRSILVVEDDQSIARLIRDYLDRAGYAVVVTGDAESALARSRSEKLDAIVLDLGLPGRDGIDMLRELRRTSNVPVVIVTARGDETDRVVGLELGADDYMVKPFSPRELVARVRAVLRRTERVETGTEQIRVRDLTLDIPRMRAEMNGVMIDLTPTEFQLVLTMATQPGRVFTRNQLLDAVHGVAFESYERAIDAHIKNIRRKLEPVPADPQYVLTVYGVGYRFCDD
jgi:DNA-binding response OmpR family regulator